MRICVYGGGAIGGHLAGHLARAGKSDVSIVARGAALTAIREHGLIVTTPSETFTTTVRVTDDPSRLGMQDYVFVTLKAHQVKAALSGLSHVIGPDTAVIPPTTGLPYFFFHGVDGPYVDRRLREIDPGDDQWRVMPPSQVLGGVVWIGAHSEAPGRVVQDGPRAGLPLGELDGGISDRVRAISDVLEHSGIRAPIRANIRGEIWMKFANSLCWNPVALLTLARMGQMADDSAIVELVAAMMREIDAVAVAMGVEVPQSPTKRIATTLSATTHKMSMLHDLENGRPLELGILVRSLAAATAISGIPTPTIDTVLTLAKLRESVAAEPVM